MPASNTMKRSYRITRIEYCSLSCAAGLHQAVNHPVCPTVWTSTWFHFENPQQGPAEYLRLLNEKDDALCRLTSYQVERRTSIAPKKQS